MAGQTVKRVALLASGFALAMAAQPALAKHPKGDVRCALPEGWGAVARLHPRYVILGEIHGTAEAPAFFGNLACTLAARGERILIALEQDSDKNAAFQTAWHLPHARFAAARDTLGWEGQNDGRESEAMFAMLERLHAARARGLSIDLVAFNGARDEAQQKRFSALPGQGPHEAAQAENIREAANAGRYDLVLVLVGNAHALKRPINRRGAEYEPMAMRLAPTEQIVSLNVKTAGGNAWTCERKPGVTPNRPVSSGDIECGSHAFRGDGDLRKPSFIALGAFPGETADGSYDGYYWLGNVTASPPALPSRASSNQ